MKKKVLFIISNLQTGGVSKSITTILNVIDKENYDINLMVLSLTGPFSLLLPKNIRIITNPVWEALSNKFTGFKFLLKKNPILALGHLFRMALSKIDKAKAGIVLSKLMPPIEETFDTIIDYNGQHQLYYMVDKLKASKKITFFHSDYSKWPYYYKADKKYFKKVDYIFTISDYCVTVMKEWFPEIKHKIGLMENISSISLINNLAKAPIKEIFKNTPNFLTIGHVCENKGTSLALAAAHILNQKGICFHWYFLGSNNNSQLYQKLVNQYKLQDKITFLGVRTNPYPYMNKATIVIHPSKFEGKSIALDEVKLLCKPVIVTNFTTVHDQFKNGYNGTICEMNPESLASSILSLLEDYELQNIYISNLRKDQRDNTYEIKKLYQIID